MKKTITIVIVILLALGFGYFLFKISPEQIAPASSSYNGALTATQKKDLSAPAAFDPNKDRFIGNPAAKNVFIEYADLQCPICAAYGPILKDVPNKFTDTVLVLRYFPLIQVHQNAVEAALAAEAAGAQGKYWEMAEKLYGTQSEWQAQNDPLGNFAKYATEIGVSNIEQFKTDITGKKYLEKIQNDFDESNNLKLSGTPSLFMNGHALTLNPDINNLKAEAEQYLVK